MFFDPAAPFVPCEYRCKLATEAWELSGYWGLRRQVFCAEQRLFEESDVDEHDEAARPIVAVSMVMGMPDRVVGAVRIYPSGPAGWYGSRLAVHPDFRGVGGIAAGLIRKAVGSAIAMGCRSFLATVQRQNVPFFRRLHWRSLEEVSVRGWPHHLMEAQLAFYPPCDPHAPIDLAPSRKAS